MNESKWRSCFIEGTHYRAVDRLSSALSGPELGPRLAGLDLNKARNRTVIAARSGLATRPEGFTTTDPAEAVRGRTGWDPTQYPTRRAAYDLAKVRGKGLVERVPGRQRYECPPEQLRVLCG
jgi:hypothetical protein